MNGEQLATPSPSATPLHVATPFRKVKCELSAEQKKHCNFSNKQKRLEKAEALVPALSIDVKTTEERNRALSEALRERDLRIEPGGGGEKVRRC